MVCPELVGGADAAWALATTDFVVDSKVPSRNFNSSWAAASASRSFGRLSFSLNTRSFASTTFFNALV